MNLHRHFPTRREHTDTPIRQPEEANTLKYILAILIFITLFLLSYNRGTASEELRTFDSNSSVLAADFIMPQKPRNAPSRGDCEAYRHIVERYDWDANIALSIMEAESRCDPSIVNDNPLTGDYSVGLMQINIYGANAKYRPSEQALKDPATNIDYAYSLWKSSGFQSQWGVCRKSVRCI